MTRKPKHSSKVHAGLDRSPKENWVDKAGGLPDFIERIAKHIHADSGLSISHAIASAINRVKQLAAKGNAKAVTALAQWTKMKGRKNLSDVQLIGQVVINMAEDKGAKKTGAKAGTKSAGITDKAKLLKAIAAYKARRASLSPEERKKIEARLKSSQQRLGMKVGLSELDDKIEVFENNKGRLSLAEQETVIKHLQALADDSGVIINLAASRPVAGSNIARHTTWNSAKHNRGMGGRWAPKVP